MITDEEVQKIIDWACNKDIPNGGTKIENIGKQKTIEWRRGVLRTKENLLKIEYCDLSIWGCENIEIPDEFFKLPKLKGLCIYSKVYNKIKAECLQNIKYLELITYDSSNKAIQESMDKLGNLTNLEYLRLDLDKLREVPASIFSLHNLKYLDISCSENIKEIPPEIKNLKNLEILYLLCCDNLSKLPKEIGELINLKELNVSSENIKEIPPEIKKLNNLERLDMSYCRNLSKLPKEIGELINLKELNVSSENIKEIPPEIKKLKNLEVLDLHYCKNLSKLPKEIGELTNLKELDLRRTNLNDMPDELSNLINLERLNGEPYIRLNNSNNKEQLLTITKPDTNKEIFSDMVIGNMEFEYKNILLKGVPGTGKSRAIENIIKHKLQLEHNKENILRVNIHSASSNSDLMQGIGISSKNGEIEYKEKQGLILNLIQKATFKPNQPFVLILEEIQENSLNELIGDLIYLIEDSKRAKDIVADNQEYDYQELVEKILTKNHTTAYVEVPYLVDDSTKYRKMIMPNNLYIFCTSNYRDDKKVIEDNLLRRFEVLEIYPKDEVVDEYCREFFKKLNENILKVMKDEMHPDRFLIGHSNWIKVDNIEKFYRAFLKVVVEFKDIKEVEFADFKDIVKNLPLVDELEIELNSYKSIIEYLQNKGGYDFFK